MAVRNGQGLQLPRGGAGVAAGGSDRSMRGSDGEGPEGTRLAV